MFSWFHDALQCHNVLPAFTVSQWPFGSVSPHSVTLVSIIPWGLAMPQWSPWIHGALQDHNSPVAARGPVMQQWPLGSTKPCCFTLGPWDHAAQQCHSDVLGSTWSPQCHNGPLVPQSPLSVTMAPSFHQAPKCLNGLHRKATMEPQFFKG